MIAITLPLAQIYTSKLNVRIWTHTQKQSTMFYLFKSQSFHF